MVQNQGLHLHIGSLCQIGLRSRCSNMVERVIYMEKLFQMQMSEMVRIFPETCEPKNLVLGYMYDH